MRNDDSRFGERLTAWKQRDIYLLFYLSADFPTACQSVASMAEGQLFSSSICAEWVLQAFWNEGGLREKSDLLTEDGRRLEIVHPGDWNLEAGPDFRDAVVRIDGAAARGDVEIHHSPQDWHAHGHTGDQRYENVILHVVWDADGYAGKPDSPPVLIMKKFVSELWMPLFEEIAADGYPYARKMTPGQCAMQTAGLEDSVVRDFLTGAGLNRFHRKSRFILDRASAVGFAQTAYELFWETLGYKANREACKNLARHVSLDRLKSINHQMSRLAAILGGAGFLVDPTLRPLPESESVHRLNLELWYRWWELGITPVDLTWQYHGLRPLNRPERRLPAGWMLLEKWRRQPVEAWAEALPVNLPPERLRKPLMKLFSFAATRELSEVLAILGVSSASMGEKRVLDVAVNVILPLLYAKGFHEQDQERKEWAETAFLSMPRLQDNQPARRIAHKLLVPASRQRRIVTGAAQQQGLLAVARDFCRPAGGNCRQCPLSHRRLIEKGLAGN